MGRRDTGTLEQELLGLNLQYEKLLQNESDGQSDNKSEAERRRELLQKKTFQDPLQVDTLDTQDHFELQNQIMQRN